jgi:multidrug efflux pump subunit AcrA (membrane-fusion protein)
MHHVMKKRIVIPLALLAAAGIVVASVLWLGGEKSTSDAPAPAAAPASVKNLTRTETLTGVVAYQDLRSLSSGKGGTITWLPAVGQDLTSGQVLMSVDAQPVVLLAGVVPAWRDLQPGMADGPDVHQLESALGMQQPDGHWTSATTKAVKELQKKAGAVDDGVLSLGEVVFTQGDVHVAKLDGNVGGLISPGAPVLTVQSTDRIVILDVDPLKRDLVPQGAPVNVELPSGKTVPGKIESVSTTLTQNADGKNIYQVTVMLDDPSQVADIALAPVTVHYVTTVAEQVLAVPVAAIIGVPGGGYAVQVVAKDGAVKRVPVELGAWGDGYVAVTGSLQAGDMVEVPA